MPPIIYGAVVVWYISTTIGGLQMKPILRSRVVFRTSDDDMAELVKAATRRGVSVSILARSLVLESLRQAR